MAKHTIVNLWNMLQSAAADYISNNAEMFRSLEPGPMGPIGFQGDKGDAGAAGLNGTNGLDLTVEQVIDNGDYTFTFDFSDGSSYTTPSLRGSTGAKGDTGNTGLQGVSVHHIKGTSTTDQEGDFGEAGQTDTYTLYGDINETLNLGTFVVKNGLSGNMATTVYDINQSGVVDNAEALGGKSLATIEAERTAEILSEILSATLALGTSYSVADHAEKDALTNLTISDKVFVADDGDTKWAHYIVTAVTDGSGATSTYEVIMDEDTYLNANTAASIKTTYESNLDTNAFTDAEQTKLSEFKITDLNVVNKIGNPIHIDTYDELYNHMYSSGITSGCEITDNGNGTINIAVGTATLRAVGDAGDGIVYSVEVPAATNIALTDNTTNYVYLSYNDGVTVLWGTTTTPVTVNMIDIVPAYVIVRNGNNIGYLDVRSQNVNHIAKAQLKEFYTQPFTRKNGGAIVSDAGTLHLACSVGAFYFQLNEYPLPALNTTGTDTFKYYSHIAGSWAEVDASTIDNFYYDNGTDLVEVASNKYSVHWIYGILGSAAKYAVLYGSQEHSNIASAQAEGAPSSVPSSIQGLGVLLGRAIVQKDATELAAVDTIFEAVFTSTLAINHENLAGLLGGGVGDHIHLTSTELTKLTNIEDNATADQVASEVPVIPQGNLSSNTVQLALEELQTDINTINQVNEW